MCKYYILTALCCVAIIVSTSLIFEYGCDPSIQSYCAKYYIVKTEVIGYSTQIMTCTKLNVDYDCYITYDVEQYRLHNMYHNCSFQASQTVLSFDLSQYQANINNPMNTTYIRFIKKTTNECIKGEKLNLYIKPGIVLIVVLSIFCIILAYFQYKTTTNEDTYEKSEAINPVRITV